MKNPYKNFDTASNEEAEGVWINYGEFRVRVARAGGANLAFTHAQDRRARVLRRTGTPTMQRLQAMMLELVAETCVKGWEVQQDGQWVSGMIDPASLELVPFSVAEVKKVFEALPNLAQAILGEANSMELFLAEELEGEAGN